MCLKHGGCGQLAGGSVEPCRCGRLSSAFRRCCSGVHFVSILWSFVSVCWSNLSAFWPVGQDSEKRNHRVHRGHREKGMFGHRLDLWLEVYGSDGARTASAVGAAHFFVIPLRRCTL